MSSRIKQANYRRFLISFLLFNILLSFTLCLSYLRYAPAFDLQAHATEDRVFLTWVFTLFSYLTQAIIINAIWATVIFILHLLRIPKKILIVLAIFFSTLINMMIVADSVTFGLYRAHELNTAISVFQANALGEVMPMSWKEIGAFVVVGITALVIEGVFGWLIWRFNTKIWRFPARKTILALLATGCLATYGTLTIASDMPVLYRFLPATDHFLLKGAAQVPYFNMFYRLLVPINHPVEHNYGNRKHPLNLATRGSDQPLQYPRKPLHFANKKTLPNILFLYIDTWRFDAFNKRVTPNIYKFAQNQLQFENYWSGGNCTKTGVFSLFYGIPAVYWDAMHDQRVGPVFINTLTKNAYQIGLFASATLKFPQFNKTVFTNIKDKITRTSGELTVDRDRQITKNFLSFLKHRDKNKPFFSFVFYDAVHNYCGGGSDMHQQPFGPAIQSCSRFSLTNASDPMPYVNRYHNAANFVDSEAAKILAQLKQKGLLKNTIVVISADHGEEFNDSHLGYWSHASSYDKYQTHIPMIVHWPGMPANKIQHFATSLDVTPTLMHRVFACKNPLRDYSTGQDLFNKGKRPFFIAASYTDYGIITKNEIIRINPNGDYTVNDRNGYMIPHAKLPSKVFAAASKRLERFYR